ncbi:hypothetical protein B0E54_01727 [Micromonospora sp. MH99]|nr:hypothetical protein [Micromonospora sp. MH99]
MCLTAWGRARAEEQRLNDLARLRNVPDVPLVAAGATEPIGEHEVDGGRCGERATAGA